MSYPLVNGIDYAFMLMDERRNRAYQQAIEEVVQKTPSPLFIIDLGAGTGLLSSMAHKAMTKYSKTGHIYAIESSVKYAEIARRNFEDNGIGCTLITKFSKNVTRGDLNHNATSSSQRRWEPFVTLKKCRSSYET